MTQPRKLNWEAIARDRLHPTITQILDVLASREVSPKELARGLGESLGNVSYHVRVLREAGLVEVARTEPRRGAIEHYCRLSAAAMEGQS